MTQEFAIAFLTYFAALLAIGVVSHRAQKSSADFIVGGRSLNFWVIALSAHASDMSSWLFMAFPAAFYLRGISQISMGVGLFIGMFLNWQFISKRLRTLTERHNSYTLPTFFENIFQDKSGLIRSMTALASVFFLASYVAAGLISMGMLFESIFHIDYYISLSVATFAVILYTFMGGFVTVAWTDLFQALFMLLVIVTVPSVAFLQLPDGWATVTHNALANQIDLRISSLASKETLIEMLFLISWGLGYFGQPHIVTKFMGIRNTKELTKSKYVGMSWMLFSLTAAATMGVIAIGIFETPLAEPELLFVELTKLFFHPLIASFFLCGLIAATISTMDNQILVAASVLSQDFYKHIVHRDASETTLLWITRLGVVVVSIIALMIAFNRSSTILDAVQYAWTGLGCAFGPLLLMSLYSKKANRYGAIAGILVGALIAATWNLYLPYLSSYPIPAMLPGFIFSTAAIWLVSKFTASSLYPK